MAELKRQRYEDLPWLTRLHVWLLMRLAGSDAVLVVRKSLVTDGLLARCAELGVHVVQV